MKKYIKIDVVFDEGGVMLPRFIIWEDGRKFEIDRVLDIRQAASTQHGGQGDRFTVSVGGQCRYLFFERCNNLTGNVYGRWFIDKPV